MTKKPRRIDYNPDNFIAGIAGQMSADQLGVYWLICTLIYSHGGPIEYDEKRFSALLVGTHWRTIRAASERLQELGKITVCDGHVMAKGCSEPLQAAFMRVSKAVDNGFKGGRPPNEISEIEKPDGFTAEKLTGVTSLSPPLSPPSSLRSDDLIDPKPIPPKRERKTKTALPDGCPTETDRVTAEKFWRDRGRDDLCARLADEAGAFRAHHAAHGSRMDDWSAAWRTWYGNAVKFNRKPQDARPSKGSGASASHQNFLAGGLLALAGDGGGLEEGNRPDDGPLRIAQARR